MSAEKAEEPFNFWQRIENYKIPLILSLVGLILFGLGLIFPFIFKSSKHPPTFSSESSNQRETSVIKIDVAGAVIKPGVYELPNGSRLEAVLNLAGGLTSEADKDWVSKNLNLAKSLADGEKVYIPVRGLEEVQTQVLGEMTKKVKLNSASAAELDTLPGVGPVTAQKIISKRPYKSVEELRTKKVVSQSTFEKLKDLVEVF